MRLLLVEDHFALAQVMLDGLRRAGFAVDLADTAQAARETASVIDYDLALLDLGLPDGNGLDLLKHWRATSSMPVIVLTARGALGDRIEGLDGGADDYIVKPVEIPELVARCRAVLRRPGNRLGLTLQAGGVVLETTHREATINGAPLKLGRREIGVLEALLRRKNRVLPRNVLLESLYDLDAEVTPNAIDAAVSRLRRALDAAKADVVLHTIRGVGWMITETTET